MNATTTAVVSSVSICNGLGGADVNVSDTSTVYCESKQQLMSSDPRALEQFISPTREDLGPCQVAKWHSAPSNVRKQPEKHSYYILVLTKSLDIMHPKVVDSQAHTHTLVERNYNNGGRG